MKVEKKSGILNIMYSVKYPQLMDTENPYRETCSL